MKIYVVFRERDSGDSTRDEAVGVFSSGELAEAWIDDYLSRRFLRWTNPPTAVQIERHYRREWWVQEWELDAPEDPEV